MAGIGDSEFTTDVLDRGDGAAHLGVDEVNAVEVQVRPSVDAEAVRRALLDAVQTHVPTLLSPGQAVAQLRETFHQARLSIGLLIGITGLVAGLGLVLGPLLVMVGGLGPALHAARLPVVQALYETTPS